MWYKSQLALNLLNFVILFAAYKLLNFEIAVLLGLSFILGDLSTNYYKNK